MTLILASLLSLLSFLSPNGGGGVLSGKAPVSSTSAVHTSGGGGILSGSPLQP